MAHGPNLVHLPILYIKFYWNAVIYLFIYILFMPAFELYIEKM